MCPSSRSRHTEPLLCLFSSEHETWLYRHNREPEKGSRHQRNTKPHTLQFSGVSYGEISEHRLIKLFPGSMQAFSIAIIKSADSYKEWMLFVWSLFVSYLWYMMTETILPVAEQAKLPKRQHRSFTPDKTAHAFGLLDSVDERVKVTVRSRGCSDVAGARLHFVLSWGR